MTVGTTAQGDGGRLGREQLQIALGVDGAVQGGGHGGQVAGEGSGRLLHSSAVAGVEAVDEGVEVGVLGQQLLWQAVQLLQFSRRDWSSRLH